MSCPPVRFFLFFNGTESLTIASSSCPATPLTRCSLRVQFQSCNCYVLCFAALHPHATAVTWKEDKTSRQWGSQHYSPYSSPYPPFSLYLDFVWTAFPQLGGYNFWSRFLGLPRRIRRSSCVRFLHSLYLALLCISRQH